ncbi:MAG: 5-formyltetrahydrofolate cyclo-ligase [Rhodospirillales bacterium]|mgnify:CR=1 FL=1|nr:5-formyltetrahydrofolate cyclo-ligase [Rhodospirillales bacterium]MDP6644960.1 5-formyltetrahydrofolate cyclo-ligase [Rhodospirillales bacterium]MDP6840504.1 5-formyltetrahydrofolate cyclo-ligase [Rhodospirillales bacterium]
MTPKSDKAAARIAAAEARTALFDAAPGAGASLAAHFMATFDPAPATTIAAYWPMRSEIDTRPLLAALDGAGCLCLLPVVAERGAPLLFRRWTPGAELTISGFGVSEPGADAAEARPEIVVVPLLGFDGEGRRIGYGGGYYDRTLAALRKGGNRPLTAVGAAFAGQRLDRAPEESFDQRLDWIVTEAGATQFT